MLILGDTGKRSLKAFHNSPDCGQYFVHVYNSNLKRLQFAVLYLLNYITNSLSREFPV